MTDKNTELQIIGGLMKRPQYLSEIDKYSLSPSDFSSLFLRYLFAAIDNLYNGGATRITPVDISNYLESSPSGQIVFKENNGIEYLQDAEYMCEEDNFPYYYKELKKINLVKDLKRMGFDTSQIYCENLTQPKAFEINQRFKELTTADILKEVKKKLLNVEKEYTQNETVQTWDLENEIDSVIGSFGSEEGIGLPVNGKIFSSIINGAELGALTIRSLASGVGKTRLAVADACKLAFPFFYSEPKGKWIKNGSCEPTLFIMTEQKPEQIIKMVLAYLTGIEESKFRFNTLTNEEKARLEIARKIIQHYKTLKLMRIPNPTIEQIKLSVREEVILSQRRYVFFDYIFISPGVLDEFRGHALRNDEVLLLMATALKDLAIEQNVSIFTSTQVYAKADDNSEIRNEASLAGGRATINKADNGIIGARPSKDEIDILQKDGTLASGLIPNIVFDVFKVRSGRWTQVRIWSYFNTGTLRLTDLFVTDSRMNPINDFFENQPEANWELNKEDIKFLEEINK